MSGSSKTSNSASSAGIQPTFHTGFRMIAKFIRQRLILGIRLKRLNPAAQIIPEQGGILSSLRLGRQLNLTKIVEFNGAVYYSPAVPAFPSPAFDNMFINGGLNFRYAGTSYKRQIDTALLAITSRCPLNCMHCYEKHNISKEERIDADVWHHAVKLLQRKGVSIIVFTGGEPLLRFETLLELIERGNKDLSDFHIHTSGSGLTAEKAQLLKKAGLRCAAVGLDSHIKELHEKIRGKGSFESAVKALEIFNNEGIFTYVNFCASPEMISQGRLYEYYSFVRNLNVGMIQLLEPKPCGSLFGAGGFRLLNAEERNKLKIFFLRSANSPEFSNYPLVYYLAFMEDKKNLGCQMGGLSHFNIDSAGNVNPCVFMPVSFGNIKNESLEEIMIRMRFAIPYPLHSECPALRLKELIKKGNDDITQFPVKYIDIQVQWNKIISYMLGAIPEKYI